MVRGTIAAVVPMDVCTRNRVNGIIATIRMINGIERIMLMIKANGLLIAGQARDFTLFGYYQKRMPSGMPRMEAQIMETATM